MLFPTQSSKIVVAWPRNSARANKPRAIVDESFIFPLLFTSHVQSLFMVCSYSGDASLILGMFSVVGFADAAVSDEVLLDSEQFDEDGWLMNARSGSNSRHNEYYIDIS